MDMLISSILNNNSNNDNEQNKLNQNTNLGPKYFFLNRSVALQKFQSFFFTCMGGEVFKKAFFYQ